jgi:hypothetical protein
MDAIQRRDNNIMQSNFFQVWADEGDSDDWQCVQTLGEPNKYYFFISPIIPDFVLARLFRPVYVG